jgi:hypothetical protein
MPGWNERDAAGQKRRLSAAQGVLLQLLRIPPPPPPFSPHRLCIDLITIFCPLYVEASGNVLLQQCDKPSLFQVSVSGLYKYIHAHTCTHRLFFL